VQRYQNLSGTSGVTHYEIGPDFIRVRFEDGGLYVYDHRSPGRHHVDAMKSLAVAGRGLSTYISAHVRTAYARRER